MSKNLKCIKCHRHFFGHGNRIYCQTCQGQNENRKRELRVEFNRIKEKVKRRDGKKCVTCGSTVRLEVHHSDLLTESESNDMSNLITLCRVCHVAVHKGQKRSWRGI